MITWRQYLTNTSTWDTYSRPLLLQYGIYLVVLEFEWSTFLEFGFVGTPFKKVSCKGTCVHGMYIYGTDMIRSHACWYPYTRVRGLPMEWTQKQIEHNLPTPIHIYVYTHKHHTISTIPFHTHFYKNSKTPLIKCLASTRYIRIFIYNKK